MPTVPKQFFSSNGSGIRNSQIWNGYRSYGSDETRGDHEEHHSGEHTLPQLIPIDTRTRTSMYCIYTSLPCRWSWRVSSPSTGWLLPSSSQASSRQLVWAQNTHFTSKWWFVVGLHSMSIVFIRLRIFFMSCLSGASCTWERGFQLVSLVWRQATPSALSVMLASVAPHSSPGSSSAWSSFLSSPRCWVSTGSSSPSICTPRNREGSHLQTILPGHQYLQQPTKYRIMLKCCDDHIDKSRYSKLWQVPIKSDPCILERGLQRFNIFMGV